MLTASNDKVLPPGQKDSAHICSERDALELPFALRASINYRQSWENLSLDT